MLTNVAVKAARPRAAAYKLFDQGGLHLYVAPTGRKSFRIKFRFGGKELLLTIGAVPEVSLDVARARCDQVRVQLGRGEDPRTCEIVQTGKACPFENVARQWHAHMRQRWTNVHAGDVLASLERDVFPAIGAMPIRTVTVPVILNALRVIQEGGGLVTASRSAPIQILSRRIVVNSALVVRNFTICCVDSTSRWEMAGVRWKTTFREMDVAAHPSLTLRW